MPLIYHKSLTYLIEQTVPLVSFTTMRQSVYKNITDAIVLNITVKYIDDLLSANKSNFTN